MSRSERCCWPECRAPGSTGVAHTAPSRATARTLTPDKRRATLFATEGNFIRLALGALPAGLLAASLPGPLRLSYVIYLAILCVVAFAVARAPETVSRPVRSTAQRCYRCAARAFSSCTAMLAGSALLLPGLALLPRAEGLHSLALLLCGTAITGRPTMLAYRGSLEVVNEIAPDERRGEVTASYILCMYAGNSLPIIGIGLLSSATSSFTADLTFALIIAACAVLELSLGAKRPLGSRGGRPVGVDRHEFARAPDIVGVRVGSILLALS